MSHDQNPYMPPAPPQHSPEQYYSGQFHSPGVLAPAGQGARFVNLFIDNIAFRVVAFGIGIVIAIVGGEQGVKFLEGPLGMFFGFPIAIAYYIVCEGTSGRTLGKLITGTKVVNEDGQAPTFGQVVGRTFCRLIPFEAFSFFGTPTRGWHDSIPKTYVVKCR